MGLTDAQIQALLSNTRTRGVYGKYMQQFLDSGENGICVNDTWAELAGKQAQTLKQGFENVREGKNAVPGADVVKVIVSGDKDAKQVFLVNLAAAGIELPTEDAEAEVAAA